MFDINNSINSFIKGKARFYSFKCANNNCNNVVSIKKSDFKYRKTRSELDMLTEIYKLFEQNLKK